jgi:putative oxidoreductase
MKIVAIIARILLGLMFLVFGLNPFLKFLPMPPLEGVWGQFLGALVVSRYVWFVGAVQVISGALFLIGRYVPLAIALSGPVVANIIVYHLTMQHSGAQPAVLATICWVILFWHYRASFAPGGCKKPSFGQHFTRVLWDLCARLRHQRSEHATTERMRGEVFCNGEPARAL